MDLSRSAFRCSVVALLVGGTVLAGCGLVESGSADQLVDPPDAASSSSSSSGSGNMGPLDGSGRTDPSYNESLVELAPQTALVHASPDLPAVRLCLSKGKSEPIPVSNIMPRSNQVGVDVGGAAYLGDLQSQVPNGSTTAYLVRTAVTERRVTESDPPQRHESCEFYLAPPNELNVDYWPVTIPPLPKTSLLVITGCRFWKEGCEAPQLKVVGLSGDMKRSDYVQGTFVALTKDASGDVKVTIDGTGLGQGTVADLSNTAQFEATPARNFRTGPITNELASSISISARRGDNVLVSGTLAHLAGVVDTTTEPARYYKDSYMAVVALGTKDPPYYDGHPQRPLHMLTLPFTVLNTTADAGPDARADGGIE